MSGFNAALEQLRELEAESEGSLEILGVDETACTLQISLDCSKTPSAPGGVSLRARERFHVAVPTRFPYSPPSVATAHTRWADTAHVQWQRHLCLYVAPGVEWQPDQGMRGFIERLVTWLRQAATDTLDPVGLPPHPPVAYAAWAHGTVVVRADTRALREAGPAGDPLLIVALARQVHPDRLDVVHWVRPPEMSTVLETVDDPALIALAAVLLPREIGFEYPGRARTLVDALVTNEVSRDTLYGLLGTVADANHKASQRRGTEDPPLHLFVGTPSRADTSGFGLAPHLVCWRFDDLGTRIAELLAARESSYPPLAQVGEEIAALADRWLDLAQAHWSVVMEDRPEIVLRRDEGSSTTWLEGKRVLVLGAGALGAPVAEWCARAGVAALTVVDNGSVKPGLLVRQPYADDDIGQPKAAVLADRLRQSCPSVTVLPVVTDVMELFNGTTDPLRDIDLVIDATADAGVASYLERHRTTQRQRWPHLARLMIGHDARRGIVTVSRISATGGGADVIRRLGIAARGSQADTLGDVADDFFPDPPRHSPFQPEPGCSEPTFIGSAVEVTALAGQLFSAVLDALAGCARGADAPMSAFVARLDSVQMGLPNAQWLTWENDVRIPEANDAYEVRVSKRALAVMRAETRRGARVRGRDIETGGILLGHIDDACAVIWIDAASGPPPDSKLSALHFQCGVEGVTELISYQRERTARASTFLGYWHTHPDSSPEQSHTDACGMAGLLLPGELTPRRALMLILGGEPEQWSAWTHDGDRPASLAQLVARDTEADIQTIRSSQRLPTLPQGAKWWPGGYAQAKSQPTRLPRKRFDRLRRRPRRMRHTDKR